MDRRSRERREMLEGAVDWLRIGSSIIALSSILFLGLFLARSSDSVRRSLDHVAHPVAAYERESRAHKSMQDAIIERDRARDGQDKALRELQFERERHEDLWKWIREHDESQSVERATLFQYVEDKCSSRVTGKMVTYRRSSSTARSSR